MTIARKQRCIRCSVFSTELGAVRLTDLSLSRARPTPARVANTWKFATREALQRRGSARPRVGCGEKLGGSNSKNLTVLRVAETRSSWFAFGLVWPYQVRGFGRTVHPVDIPCPIDSDEKKCTFIGFGPRLMDHFAGHEVE